MTSVPQSLRVGTRQSPLAMAQTGLVVSALQQAFPGLVIETISFTTQGDQFLEAPLAQIGDKGLFVKELEEALLSGTIDIAVHSLKDMLSTLPEGLVLTSVLTRNNPRDVLISPRYSSLKALPQGATVATGSLRRMAQLKQHRPDLQIVGIRGNINTRLKKLEEGHADALILAAAGIERMGWGDRVRDYLDPVSVMIPAVGQGILAVEYRNDQAGRQTVLPLLAAVQDETTQVAMTAERAFLSVIDAEAHLGCQVPMGIYAEPVNETQFNLHGIVLSPDGHEALQATLSFPANPQAATRTGEALAQQLLDRGARELLVSASQTV
ncbi:MAG: hydroxymethylbilane synthase [Candidatus Melainabacteria bacterium]